MAYGHERQHMEVFSIPGWPGCLPFQPVAQYNSVAAPLGGKLPGNHGTYSLSMPFPLDNSVQPKDKIHA